MPTSITSSGITFNDTTTQTTAARQLTLSTSVPTTSGVAIDFTPIPSWVNRITVMLNGVSTNGTSVVIFQLGTSSGFVTSGYTSNALYGQNNVALVGAQYTTGFGTVFNSAANIRTGNVQFCKLTGNTWVGSGILLLEDITSGGVASLAGKIALSSAVTQVRLTTVIGSETFDAGSVNISYEG